MSLLDSILGAGGLNDHQVYGCCSLCGASSRAVRRADGSWGPVHRAHCQTLRETTPETFPVINPPTPIESIPGPNGCPAAHLLVSDREAFAKASKDQVDAIWRISEVIQERITDDDLTHDAEDLEFYRRIMAICAWALGNTRQLKNPDDVAALSPSIAAARPSPGKPS